MIEASPAVHANKQLPGFYLLAVGEAGWAVNEDYYGEGAQFVLGNNKGTFLGCIMLSGGVAAFALSGLGV